MDSPEPALTGLGALAENGVNLGVPLLGLPLQALLLLVALGGPHSSLYSGVDLSL